MSETITLNLEDATDSQLRVALDDAESMARACDSTPGITAALHTWHHRAEAIREEMGRRTSLAMKEKRWAA